MKMLKVVTCAMIACLLFGCSSPTQNISKYPPHTNKIFITEQSLPVSVEFDLVATVEGDKGSPWSSTAICQDLADKARKLGGDAIIQFDTSYQWRFFSLGSRYGSGQVVKFMDDPKVVFSKLSGEWY